MMKSSSSFKIRRSQKKVNAFLKCNLLIESFIIRDAVWIPQHVNRSDDNIKTQYDRFSTCCAMMKWPQTKMFKYKTSLLMAMDLETLTLHLQKKY